MSYQEQSDLYRSSDVRSRAEMCIREQALIFAGDGRPDIKALADGVVGGVWADIDAVIAAVCVSPNWDSLGDDGALLAAVQGVWPVVAAARYGVTG